MTSSCCSSRPGLFALLLHQFLRQGERRYDPGLVLLCDARVGFDLFNGRLGLCASGFQLLRELPGLFLLLELPVGERDSFHDPPNHVPQLTERLVHQESLSVRRRDQPLSLAIEITGPPPVDAHQSNQLHGLGQAKHPVLLGIQLYGLRHREVLLRQPGPRLSPIPRCVCLKQQPVVARRSIRLYPEHPVEHRDAVVVPYPTLGQTPVHWQSRECALAPREKPDVCLDSPNFIDVRVCDPQVRLRFAPA